MARTWKLQWAPTTIETARAAEHEMFFRVDENVTMIYSQKRNALFNEADDRFAGSMSQTEVEWLQECIGNAMLHTARRHPEKALQNDQTFMEAFERELAKEKVMLEGKEDARNGGTKTQNYVGNQSENQQPEHSRT